MEMYSYIKDNEKCVATLAGYMKKGAARGSLFTFSGNLSAQGCCSYWMLILPVAHG
jgi:hypothetical protein